MEDRIIIAVECKSERLKDRLVSMIAARLSERHIRVAGITSRNHNVDLLDRDWFATYCEHHLTMFNSLTDPAYIGTVIVTADSVTTAAADCAIAARKRYIGKRIEEGISDDNLQELMAGFGFETNIPDLLSFNYESQNTGGSRLISAIYKLANISGLIPNLTFLIIDYKEGANEKDKAYRGLTGLLDDDFFVMTVGDTESVYFDDKEMNKLVNNIMEHIKKKLIITIDYLL